jgi:hypothetical protein
LTLKKYCFNLKYKSFSSDDSVENVCGVFYRYKYADRKIEEVGYRSENNPFLYYELNINPKGQIASRIVKNGYPNEGNTYYFYDEKNRKIRIEEYDFNKQLYKKKLFHYQKDKIIKSEEYFYVKTDKIERIMNLIKFKSYSGKSITYYFNENDSLINKK